MNFILIQGIGFLALILGMVTYQINKRKNILILQTICNVLYGTQYFLLGSVNSMFMCLIGAVRNTIFCYDSKMSNRNRRFMLIAIIALLIISTIFYWNGILSFLGCAASIISTLAVWQKKEKNIRILSFISFTIWMGHDILIGSYAGIIDNIMILISILAGMYRFDTKCRKVVSEE